MEAENFLLSGYGTRLALEAKLGAAARLGRYVKVWQPSRLKGIIVAPEFGAPFLAATQVFDARPIPRKFLSLNRTDNSKDRFVAVGDILVTCSGSVGRATLATSALKDVLISHDLLRANPLDRSMYGWVYAYLRSKTARSMMVASRYGHIIKHLEPSHLAALPMPVVRGDIAEEMRLKTEKILNDRNRAYDLFEKAEQLFELSIGEPSESIESKSGFVVAASSLVSGRRRLEAVVHSPVVRSLRSHFSNAGYRVTTIQDAGFDVWLPTRFQRIPAVAGVELVGSADLFEINPDLEKRIADIDFGDPQMGRVCNGWLLLARSGQTYGINGSAVIANKFHEGKIISDDAIRIAPKADCTLRVGYLYTAMSHPTLGRPLVKALAYGSSIPHIEPMDVASLPIVRLDGAIENRIADMTEEAASLFADADIAENQMTDEVDSMLYRLLEGDRSVFVL